MEFLINNLLTEEELPEFFISVGVLVNSSKEPIHAGIILKFDENTYLCHYPYKDEKPILEKYDNNKYFFNLINCFGISSNDEIEYIYNWLRIICKKSSLTYGHIISESSYSTLGTFEDSLDLGEVGTCVSFCLYILNHLAIDENKVYLDINDWDDSEINEEEDEIYRNILKLMNQNFDEEKYLQNRKRIKPLDLYTASFSDDLPIDKLFVDIHRDFVYNKILEKL